MQNNKDLARDLNLLLSWARQEVTDKEASTGLMSFTGIGACKAPRPFGYAVTSRYIQKLKELELIRRLQHRGPQPPLWWVDPNIIVTEVMLQRLSKSRHGEEGAVEKRLRAEIAHLKKQLAAAQTKNEAMKRRVREALR